jgi:hypothetical protein
MKPLVASLAVMFSLVAGAALAQAPARSCVRVEVSSGPAPIRGSAPTAVRGSVSTLVPAWPRFSATGILDLTFTVLFPSGFGGEHLVELRVFTPDAQLYRSMAMPVASRGQANATRSVDGYARPLPQRPLMQVSRGRSLFAAASTTFPVAGTDIVSSGLYGSWRVEAYLDGAEQACTQAARFTLNP